MTPTTLLRRLALVAVPAAAALALTAGPAQASGGNGTAQLNPGQTLLEGQKLVHGTYQLRMQSDGNLVLYTGSRACWATHTNNSNPETHAYMEPGGDFAVFEESHAVQLWHTGSSGPFLLYLDTGRKGPVLQVTTGDPVFSIPAALKNAHC